MKNRETRGAASPLDVATLARIPLHDVGFEGSALSYWPGFHAAAKEIFARCLDPDPAKRIDAKGARALFVDGFRMRNAGEAGPRPWVQGIFQMRPRANRLVRDLPLGGIRIREEAGDFVAVEAPPPEMKKVGRESVVINESPPVATERRPSGRLANVPPPPKGMVYLADVLREFKAKRPLPVKAPVLVTRTGLSPADLVKCTIFSLEQAREHVRISDQLSDQVTESHRVSVGRGDDNDIVVNDTSVSKHHLHLEKGADGGWWVIDNDSSNGTFLDDEELQKKGKMRLSRGLATIGLGLTAKLTFMQAAELDGYLARALDVWAQAFAAKASGRHKPLEEGGTVVQRQEPGQTEIRPPAAIDPLTPAPSPRAPTKKQVRGDELKRRLQAMPATPYTPSAARPLALTKDELVKKLSELTDVASFAVHFEGARADDFESVSEVLDALASGETVLGVDVVLRTGKKIVLYRRDPPS